jgi:protein-disulfide isomerase
VKNCVSRSEWWLLGAALLAFTASWLELRAQLTEAIRPTDIPGACLDPTATVFGPSRAPWRVVTFMDYDCPPCRRLDAVASATCRACSGRLRWEVVMFPLPSHPNAPILARVSLAAARAARLPIVHSILFDTWNRPLKERLTRAASAMAVSMRGLARLTSLRCDAELAHWLFIGRCLGIQGTPSVFLVSPAGRVWAVADPGAIQSFIESSPDR